MVLRSLARTEIRSPRAVAGRGAESSIACSTVSERVRLTAIPRTDTALCSRAPRRWRTGRGCDNSASTGGASINATGRASIASDSLIFTTANELSAAASALLSGTLPIANGTAFGQGVRCVGGNLKRLHVEVASGGSITVRNAGDPSVSTLHANLGDPNFPGEHRYYMVYYRDPVVLGGCPSANTFNGTNAVDVSWLP